MAGEGGVAEQAEVDEPDAVCVQHDAAHVGAGEEDVTVTGGLLDVGDGGADDGNLLDGGVGFVDGGLGGAEVAETGAEMVDREQAEGDDSEGKGHSRGGGFGLIEQRKEEQAEDEGPCGKEGADVGPGVAADGEHEDEHGGDEGEAEAEFVGGRVEGAAETSSE